MAYRMLAPDGVVYDVDEQNISAGLQQGGALYDTADTFSFFNPLDSTVSKRKKSQVSGAVSEGLQLMPSSKIVQMVGPDMRLYDVDPDKVSEGLAQGGSIVLNPDSLLINPQDPLTFPEEKTVDNTGEGGVLSRPKNWLDAVGEVMDRPLSYLPYLNAVDVFESAKFYQAAKAAKNGTITPEQDSYLNAKLADAQRDKTFGYKVWDIILRMPSYAIEFMTAGGAIKNLSKAAILKSSGGKLKALTDDAAERLGSRLGLDAAATAGLKTAQNTQDLTRIVATAAGPEGIKRAGEISKKVVEAALDEKVLDVPQSAGTAVANFFLRDTTSGVMQAASKLGAENAALQAARRAGTATAGAGISQATLKQAGEAATASIAQAAGMALGPRAVFSAGRIANSVVANMTPEFQLQQDDQGNVKRVLVNEGDDFWAAFAKAYGDMSIENLSESIGENFLFLKGAFGDQAKNFVKSGFLARHAKDLADKVATSLPATTADRATVAKRLVTNFLFGKNGEPGIVERLGFNGYFSELGEEAVGGVLRQALGITPIGLPSMEDVAAMAVGFALNPLAIGAVAYESANQVIADTTSKVMERVKDGEAFRSAESLAPVAEEIRTVADKLSRRPTGFFDSILSSAFYKPYARAQARAIGRAFQPGVEGQTPIERAGLLDPTEQGEATPPLDVRNTVFLMESLGRRIQKVREEKGASLPVSEILPDATVARMLHSQFGVQFAAADVDPDLRNKLNDLQKRGLVYAPKGYGRSGMEHLILRAENGQSPLSEEEFQQALVAYPYLGDVVDLTKNENVTSRVRDLLEFSPEITEQEFLVQLLGSEEAEKLAKGEEGLIRFDASNPRLVAAMEGIFYPEKRTGAQTPVSLAAQARSNTDMALAAQSTFYRVLKIAQSLPRDMKFRIGSTMVIEGTAEQISESLNKGYKDLEKAGQRFIRTTPDGKKVFRVMVNGLNFPGVGNSYGDIFIGTAAARFGDRNPALAHEVMENILRYESDRSAGNTDVDTYAFQLLREYSAIARSKPEDQAYSPAEKAAAQQVLALFSENPTELITHQLEVSLGLVSGQDLESFSSPMWLLRNVVSLPGVSDKMAGQSGEPVLGIMDVFRRAFEFKYGTTGGYTVEQLEKLLKDLGAVRSLQDLNDGGVFTDVLEGMKPAKGKVRKAAAATPPAPRTLNKVETVNLASQQQRYEDASPEVKALVQQIINRQKTYGEVSSDASYYYIGGTKEANRVPRMTVLSTQAAGLKTPPPSRAAVLGTEFHNAMSQLLAGVAPEEVAKGLVSGLTDTKAYPESLAAATEAVTRLREQMSRFFTLDPKLWITEQFLTDNAKRAAGTIDAIYFNPTSKKFEIYDWKTLLGVPWDPSITDVAKVELIARNLEAMRDETAVRDVKEMQKEGTGRQTERQALKFKYQVSGYSDLLSQVGLPSSQLSDQAFIVPVSRTEKDLDKAQISDFQIEREPVAVKTIPDAISKLSAEVKKITPAPPPAKVKGAVRTGLLSTEEFEQVPTYNLTGGKSGIYSPKADKVPLLKLGEGAYEDPSVFGFGPRTVENSPAYKFVIQSQLPDPTKVGEVRQLLIGEYDVETNSVTNYPGTPENWEAIQEPELDATAPLFPNGFVLENKGQYLAVGPEMTLEQSRELIDKFLKGEVISKEEGQKPPSPPPPPPKPKVSAEELLKDQPEEIKTAFEAIIAKQPKLDKQGLLTALQEIGAEKLRFIVSNESLLSGFVESFTLDPGATPQAQLSSMSSSFENMPDEQTMRDLVDRTRGDLEDKELIRELPEAALANVRRYLESNDLKKAYLVADAMSQLSLWNEETISPVLRAMDESDIRDLTGKRTNESEHNEFSDDNETTDGQYDEESIREEGDLREAGENDIFVSEIQQADLGRRALSRIATQLGFGRDSYVRIYNWFQSPLVRSILTGQGGVSEDAMIEALREDLYFKYDKTKDDKEVRLAVADYLSGLKRRAAERGIEINLRDRWVTSALVWTNISRIPYVYVQYNRGSPTEFYDVIADRSRMAEQDLFRHIEKSIGTTDAEARAYLEKKIVGDDNFIVRSVRIIKEPERKDWRNFNEVTSTYTDPKTGQTVTVPLDWERLVKEVSSFTGIPEVMLYSGFQYGGQWHRNFLGATREVFTNMLLPLFQPDARGVAPISSMTRLEIKNEVFNAFQKRGLSNAKVPLSFLYQMSSEVNPSAVPARLQEEAKALYSTPQDHLGAHGKRKSGVRGRMLISDELDNNGVRWRVLDYAKGFKRQAFDNDRLTAESIYSINRLAYREKPSEETYWQWFGRGGDSDVILQAEVTRARTVPQLKELRDRVAKILLDSGYTEAELDAQLPSEAYINGLRGKEPTVVAGRKGEPDTLRTDESWYQANYALNVALLQTSTMGSPSGAGKKESDFPKRIKSGFTPGFQGVIGIEGGLGETYNELLIDLEGFEGVIPPEIDGFDLLVNESKWHKSFGDVIALGRSVGGSGKWAMMKPIHSQRDALRKSSVGLLEFLAETQPDSLYGALQSLVEQAGGNIDMIRITTAAKVKGKGTKILKLSDLVTASTQPGGTDKFELVEGAIEKAAGSLNGLNSRDFKIVLDPRAEIEPEADPVPVQLTSTFIDGTGGTVVQDLQEVSTVLAQQFNEAIEDALTGKLVYLREITARYLRDSNVTSLLDAAIEKYGNAADYTVLSPVAYDRISQALHIFASEYTSRPVLNGFHAVNTPSGAQNDPGLSTETAVQWDAATQDYVALDRTAAGYETAVEQDGVEMRMARVLANVGDGRPASEFRNDHVSSIEARVFAALEIAQNPERYADLFKPGMYAPTELRSLILDSERAKAVAEAVKLVQARRLREAHDILKKWVQTNEIDVESREGGLFASIIPSQPIFWMRVPASSGASTGFGRVSRPIAGGEAQLILSYEDSKKAGADHDGDKWFVYTLTFGSDGKVIVPRTATGKFQTRGLANQSMIAMVEHFYGNPKSHVKRYQALDLKRLDPIAKLEEEYEAMVSKTKQTPERTWTFGEHKQLENFRQSQVGVMTRGVFAANNRVYKMFMASDRPWLSSYNLEKFAQMAPEAKKDDIFSITTDETGSIIFQGKRTADARAFRLVIGNVDRLNQDIAPQILDTLLQLSVDNDKERKIPLFGLNRESAGVATALLMSNPELHRPGVTEKQYVDYFGEIVKFLKSPAVSKFYNLLENRNSPEGRTAIQGIKDSVTDNAYDFPMPSTESKALRYFLLYGTQTIKEELRTAYRLLSTGRTAVRSNVELYELQNLFLDAKNGSDQIRRQFPHRRNTATVTYTGARGEEMSDAEYEREALEKVATKKGNAVLIYYADQPQPGHSDELFFRLDLQKSPGAEGQEPQVTDEFFERNVRAIEDLLEQIGDLQRELSGFNVQIGPKELVAGGLVLTKIGDSGVSRLEKIAETAPRTYAAIRDAMGRFGKISSFKLVNAANLVSNPSTGELNEFGKSIEEFINTNRSIMRYSPEVTQIGRTMLNRSMAKINRAQLFNRPIRPFEARMRLGRSSKRLMTVLMAQALPENMRITDSQTGESGVNYRLKEQLEKLQKENPDHPLYSTLIINDRVGQGGRRRPVIELTAGYTIAKSMDELATAKNEIRDAILKSEVAGTKIPPVPAEFLADLYAASLLEFGLDTVNSSRSGNPLRLLPVEVGEMFAKAAWEESKLWNTASLEYENKLWDRYGDFLTREEYLPSPTTYDPAVGYGRMVDAEQTARTINLEALNSEPEITSHKVAAGLPSNILELSANSGVPLSRLKVSAIDANRAAGPGGTASTRTTRPEMWQLRIQTAPEITTEEQAAKYAADNNVAVLDGTGENTFKDKNYDYNKPDQLPYSYISARQPRPLTAGDAVEQGKKTILLWTPVSKGDAFIVPPAWLNSETEEGKKRQTITPKAKIGDLIRIKTIGQDGQTQFKYLKAVAAPEEIDYLIADLTAYRPGKNKYPRFENLPSAERLKEFELENLKVRPAERFVLPSDPSGRPLSLSYFFPGAGVVASEVAMQYKEQTAPVVFTPLINTLAPAIPNSVGEELKVPFEATQEKLKKVDAEALALIAWSSDGYLTKRLDAWVKEGQKLNALPYQKKISDRVTNLKNKAYTQNVRVEMAAFATAADAAAKVKSAFLFAGKGRIVDGQFINDTEARISLEQAIGLLLANSEYKIQGVPEAIPVFVYDEGTAQWYKMPLTSSGLLTPVAAQDVKIRGDHFIFGSTNLGADGKRAMEELFERGFNEPRRVEEPTEPTGPEARGTEGPQASLSPLSPIRLDRDGRTKSDFVVYRGTSATEETDKNLKISYWAPDPTYAASYNQQVTMDAPEPLRQKTGPLVPTLRPFTGISPTYPTDSYAWARIEQYKENAKVLKSTLPKGKKLLDLTSYPQTSSYLRTVDEELTTEEQEKLQKSQEFLTQTFPEISKKLIQKSFYKGSSKYPATTDAISAILINPDVFIRETKKKGYDGFLAFEKRTTPEQLSRGFDPEVRHQAVWLFKPPKTETEFNLLKDGKFQAGEARRLEQEIRQTFESSRLQASLSPVAEPKRVTGKEYRASNAAMKRLDNWPEDFSPKRQQEKSLEFMQDPDIPAFEKTLFEIAKGESPNMTKENLKRFQRTLVALLKAGPSNQLEISSFEDKLKAAGLSDPQIQEITRVTALELPEGTFDVTTLGVHREVGRYAEWPLSSSTAGNEPKFVKEVLGSGVQAQVTAMTRWMDPRNPFIEGAAEDKVFQQNLDLSNLVMQAMWDNQTEDSQAREILGINGDYIRVMTPDEMSGKMETNIPIFRQKNKFALAGKVTDADRFMTTEFASAVQEMLGHRVQLLASKGELPTYEYLKDRTLRAGEYKRPFGLTWDDVMRAERDIKTSKAKEFKDLRSYGTVIQGLGAKVLGRKVEPQSLMKHDKELFEAGKKEILNRLKKETKIIWGRKGPMEPVYQKDDEGNVVVDKATKQPVLLEYKPKEGDVETVESVERRWENSPHYKRLVGEGRRPKELLSLEYWATRVAEEMETTLQKINEAHRKTLSRNYIRRRAGFVPRGGQGFGALTPDEERWLFARQEEIKSRTVSLAVVNAFNKDRYDGRTAFTAKPSDLQKKIYRALTGSALTGQNSQAEADEKIFGALWAELGKELMAFRFGKTLSEKKGLNRVVEGINLQDLYKYLSLEVMPILQSPVNTTTQETRQFNTWYDRSVKTGELPKTLNVFELKKDYTRQVFNSVQKRLVLSAAVTTRDMEGRPMAFVSLDPKFDPESPGAVLPPSVLATMVNNWVEYLRVSGVDYKHNFNAPLEAQVGEIARLLNGVAPGDRRTEGLSGYERFGEGNLPGIERVFANRGAASSALKMIADSEYHKEISLFGRDIDITRLSMDTTQLSKMSAVSFSAFFPLAGLEQQIGYWGQFPEFWTSTKKFLGKSDFKLGRKNMTEEGVKVRGFLGFVRALFNRTDPDINRLISDFTREGLVLDLSKSPDVHLAQLENFMKRVGSFLRIEGKPARKALIPVEHLFRAQLKYSQWLFGEFFPILKMHGAYLIYKQTQNNYQELFGKDWSEKHRQESIKWIAQQMNDGFGGQNWASYKFATPKFMQTMNLGMFAFNWTMSTANTMGLNVVLEKLGLGPEISSPQIRQMILNNTLMFSIALLIWPNILQSMIYASFGDPDEKDKPFTLQNEDGRPLHVDITPIMRKMSWYTGDQTGERRYYVRWGKQIYEVVDGWLTQPVRTLGSKMSLPVQAVWEQIFGSTPGSGGDFAAPFKDAGLAGIFWTQEEGFMGSRLATLASYTLPFSVQAISGSSKEAFLFGTFASVSKGKSTGAATNDMIKILKTYAWPSIWEELNTKPEGKENLRALAYGVVEAAERNGYPTKQIIDTARSAVMGDLYKRAIKAMDDGDMAEFERFAKGILRVNGTARGLLQSIKSGERIYGQPKLELTPEMEQAIREAFSNP